MIHTLITILYFNYCSLHDTDYLFTWELIFRTHQTHIVIDTAMQIHATVFKFLRHFLILLTFMIKFSP